jgi:Flp pilus assembly protein TadG
MRVLKLLLVVIILAVVLIGAFELISPSLTTNDAHNAANDVANAAAAKIYADKSKPFPTISQDARRAANAQASADHVTLTSFTITGTAETVRVTVVKEAKSIIVKRINAWKHFDEITASATAEPHP